jgi:hypothetical protein
MPQQVLHLSTVAHNHTSCLHRLTQSVTDSFTWKPFCLRMQAPFPRRPESDLPPGCHGAESCKWGCPVPVSAHELRITVTFIQQQQPCAQLTPKRTPAAAAAIQLDIAGLPGTSSARKGLRMAGVCPSKHH